MNPTGPEITITPEHPKLKELLPKLDALEKALLANDPKMPGHLKEIHKYLIQFEELAHLLSETDIAKILDAQQKIVGIKLAEETKKGSSKTTNAIKGTAEKSISDNL